MSKNKKQIRYGSHEYMMERNREVIRTEAQLNHKDRLRVYLSFKVDELKEMKHPLYGIIKKAFPEIQDDATLDDVRITKLFENMISLGSSKAIELSYKLDGSMSDLAVEPDYDAINDATKGVK